MLFKDVTGHEGIKTKLRGLIKDNRLSHAMLFLGKEGSGALPLVLAFSQYLVCDKIRPALTQQPSPGLFGEQENIDILLPEEACGECSACIKSSQFIHPDIHFSFPVIKIDNEPPISADWYKEWREFLKLSPYGNLSDWLQFIKAESKQPNITSRECQQILNNLSIKSHESVYKIQIIWMAEFLEKESNKLLKLIEEPPQNTVFFLIAENSEKILPTIKSRSLPINIPLPDDETIAGELVLRKKISEEKAREIASICEGNYREALLLVENSESDWQEIFREWLNRVYKYRQKPILDWIDSLTSGGREYQKQFLRHALLILEMALQLKTMNREDIRFREEDLLAAKRMEAMLTIAQIEAITREFNDALYYIERNANGKLLFHALSVKLHYIIKKNSLILVN